MACFGRRSSGDPEETAAGHRSEDQEARVRSECPAKGANSRPLVLRNRAVRAALAIQRSLAELNRKNASSEKPSLAARIAIDLGPVVIDAAGEIFGDVPNIAAQAFAEPGTVIITARGQRQVAGLFVAEEHGSHELKGMPEPVTLYRICATCRGGVFP